MNDELKPGFDEFYNFFSNKNYEKSRRFNQSFKYDPEPLKLFLEKLGNPQKSYHSVHVAGTTGKGSAAVFMSRALGNSFSTGLYISPHLENLEERISIQNHSTEIIPAKDFLQIWNSIKKIQLVNELSFFDALTAIAMLYFKERNVQWAVFETGLGGKHDSTNNVTPDFCILTPIGLDHQNILGDTIEKITSEKGGIIKQGIPVYAWTENPQVRNCLDKICFEVKTYIKFFQPLDHLVYTEQNYKFIKWIYEDFFKKQMPGIRPDIKGRLEVLKDNPYIIFDSAHNLISFRELLFWLQMQSGKWNIYLNMMKERNIFEIIDLIKTVKNTNLQIKLFLYPVDEPGYFTENDFKDESVIKILSREGLVNQLCDKSSKHLVAGSMRLYPKITSLAQIFSEP